MIQIPEFKTRKELYKFLYSHKNEIFSLKKNTIKHGDGIAYTHKIDLEGKISAVKSEVMPDPETMTDLKVTAIINTTNFMDSHDDVHIPGLWNKSLQENKMIMHLQEHEMEFEKIISSGSDLKAYVQIFKWADLGFDYMGNTQALIFDSVVRKTRNPYMLNQYLNGWVVNHSVGMRYVRLGFAFNDSEYPNEFDAWNKYYPEIANKERADEKGYFYYVLEAKVIEGSAVPIGSNQATPTIFVGQKTNEEVNFLKSILNGIDAPNGKPEQSTCTTPSKDVELLRLINNKF